MSSDMMIICKEDDSVYDGEGSDKAFFIDECSMGDPWNDFGKWFQRRYCRVPSMTEQIMGVATHRDHDWLELTEHDVLAIMSAFEKLEKHEKLDVFLFEDFIKAHIGKHISTENW